MQCKNREGGREEGRRAVPLFWSGSRRSWERLIIYIRTLPPSLSPFQDDWAALVGKKILIKQKVITFENCPTCADEIKVFSGRDRLGTPWVQGKTPPFLHFELGPRSRSREKKWKEQIFLLDPLAKMYSGTLSLYCIANLLLPMCFYRFQCLFLIFSLFRQRIEKDLDIMRGGVEEKQNLSPPLFLVLTQAETNLGQEEEEKGRHLARERESNLTQFIVIPRLLLLLLLLLFLLPLFFVISPLPTSCFSSLFFIPGFPSPAPSLSSQLCQHCWATPSLPS